MFHPHFGFSKLCEQRLHLLHRWSGHHYFCGLPSLGLQKQLECLSHPVRWSPCTVAGGWPLAPAVRVVDVS